MDNTTAYLLIVFAAGLFGFLGFLLGRYNRSHTVDIQLDDYKVAMSIAKAMTAAGISGKVAPIDDIHPAFPQADNNTFRCPRCGVDPASDTCTCGGYLNSAGFPIELEDAPKNISLFTDSIDPVDLPPEANRTLYRCANCGVDMDKQFNEWRGDGEGANIWKGEKGLYCCFTCREIAHLTNNDRLSDNYKTGQPGCAICQGTGTVDTLRSKRTCVCTAQVLGSGTLEVPVNDKPAHGSGPLPGKNTGGFIRDAKYAAARSARMHPKVRAEDVQAMPAEPEKYGAQGQE
jgi:hypothetical protein